MLIKPKSNMQRLKNEIEIRDLCLIKINYSIQTHILKMHLRGFGVLGAIRN